MNNDDLISRQAALEKVRAMQTYKLFVDDDMILVDKAEVQTELMMLPAAQPEIEPRTGHWIEDAKTYYEELKKRSLGVDEYTPYFTDDIACSECLAKYSVLDNETQFFKYCPNCGARMEEENHE